MDIVPKEIKEKMLEAISYIENSAQDQSLDWIEASARDLREEIEELEGKTKEEIDKLVQMR